MTIINGDKKVDYWDQVETSQSFNTGITGNKLISDSHVQARKPGETDWFRVFGTKPARPEDQEMFGQPKFPIEPKEVIKKAFNDKVITPGNFESNPYVMRVLAATQIQTGEKV
jgi:hypothetical protein